MSTNPQLRGLTRPVALVTGASRGIGKACAVALAQHGFDVALLARSVNEGEQREHSPTIRRTDTRPLPGSLATTAAAVRAAGSHALAVPCDLADASSVQSAIRHVEQALGHVTVLVNNARYVGPGHFDGILDTSFESFRAHYAVNVDAPFLLIQALLPHMVNQGHGTIVNMTSGAAWSDPRDLPIGISYGTSKAALLRMSAFIDAQYGSNGIRCIDVDPGGSNSERIGLERPEEASMYAPPEVVAATVAWLATDPSAARYNGQLVDGLALCGELRLLPWWTGRHDGAGGGRPGRVKS